ncbi:MAG: tetratricopeptide repeat protein [Deltaproteobacteria bacterium]|nr:tetratricopeptide repeat protein [Deltaproteobacteria bacterium]
MRKSFWVVLLFATVFFIGAASFAREISTKEFLVSSFVKTFRNKKYEKALKECDALLKKYPNDPLLLRYRALTLEKLHQVTRAIQLYRQILAAYPGDIPARLFLGLAYIKLEEYEKARRELRFVSRKASSAEYRHWAEAQLNRLRENIRTAGKPVKKKAYVIGKGGVAYDSNPLLVPNNGNLSSRNKADAARFMVELNAGYPLWLKRNFRADILYIGEAYLHTEGARDADFTSQGIAFDSKRRVFAGKRSVLLGGRYDFRANLLKTNLFSIVNRFYASADTSFFPKTQTHFYGRFGILEYASDGANPAISSRDGIRGGMGLTQYFYKSNFKTFFFIKGEGNFDRTRGDNFDRWGALTRAGAHMPLVFVKKTDLDLSGGFSWGSYPNFQSLSALDTRTREDHVWDLYAGVTRHWKPNFASRLFYRFIGSENDNDFFDRTRHIAGGKVIFSL